MDPGSHATDANRQIFDSTGCQLSPKPIPGRIRQNGKPVASVKKGFRSAVRVRWGWLARRRQRHTAAIWLMQRGAPFERPQAFPGISAEVLLGTHGHPHPDFLHGAANAITSEHRVSVVE
jgi:hypothetical protein